MSARPDGSSHPLGRATLGEWGSVLAGGAVGSLSRSLVSRAIPAPAGSFPSATLVVNVAGSLLLGFYLARRERSATSRWSLQFWAVGLLGSLTTFSTFSFEVFTLLRVGAGGTALSYVAASMVAGLAAAHLGLRTGSLR